MNCKATLSDDFVLNNTSLAWRTKKYKPYRENLLFDIERAQLPNTQVFAEIYQKARSLTATAEATLSTINSEWFNTKKPRPDDIMATNMIWWAYEGRTNEHMKIIGYCKRPIATHGRAMWGGMGYVKEQHRSVVKACITTDCAGFLDADFNCGLCDVKVCKACHESLTDDHVCNEDTVATIKAIKAEARGCPKCATLISKIDGCDQMWCTQCHATFSWRTGQIEEGHTHNPHYYEYMRKNGGLPRAPGDVGCGGFPRLNDIVNVFVSRELREAMRLNGVESLINKSNEDDKLILKILDVHRHLIHIEHDIRLRLNVVQPDNHDLRVQFLTKEISASKMKALLQMRDKAYRKNLAKSQIYQMTYNVGGDLFRTLLTNKNINEAKTALINLFTYSNSCLDKLAEAYICKVKHYEINL
jgi:hypothetical protein